MRISAWSSDLCSSDLGWLLFLCIIWGISIVADSPQFSASITELADREHVGTMLTIQTCAGFLLSMITIHLLPWLAGTAGWRWVFLALEIGRASCRERVCPDG